MEIVLSYLCAFSGPRISRGRDAGFRALSEYMIFNRWEDDPPVHAAEQDVGGRGDGILGKARVHAKK